MANTNVCLPGFRDLFLAVAVSGERVARAVDLAGRGVFPILKLEFAYQAFSAGGGEDRSGCGASETIAAAITGGPDRVIFGIDDWHAQTLFHKPNAYYVMS